MNKIPCFFPQKSGCIILSRAICGRSTQGNEELCRPPYIDPNDPSKGFFDSCTNQAKDIFVIFDNAQIYPEYLIEFESVDPFKQFTVKD